MKAEFERLSQKKPMDVLSMKRYELPPPSTGRMNDLQAWTECVENSMAQLEHQTTRYSRTTYFRLVDIFTSSLLLQQ